MEPDTHVGSNPLPGDSVIKEMQTRFVYPFSFESKITADLMQRLLGDQLTLGSGKTVRVWTQGVPNADYQDELLDHAQEFLFPNPGEDDCTYLKLSAEVAEAWFKNLILQVKENPSVVLVPDRRIEIFLSPKGLGILSLTLTPKDKNLSAEEACRFNYTIGQFKRRDVAGFRRSTPRDSPESWQKMSKDQQELYPDSPDEKAPLADRLGAPGGIFFLHELIERRLLACEESGLHPAQKELSVYTVARLGPDVDFASSACRNALASLLSGLAQLEEPTHAGATAEILGVANAVLNRKHWAAVGQLGAAHLIADQPPPEGLKEHPFNGQRLPIIRDKYFIPYLMASFQKLALNRAADKARQAASLPDDCVEQSLEGCRRDLLEFGVNGYFAQVSARDVLHRFYRLVQQGLDIPFIWQSVRETISDLDAKFSSVRQEDMAKAQLKIAASQARAAEAQGQIAKSMNENLHEIAKVQNLLHVIEYVLVTVYIAHLVHMVLGERHAIDWVIVVAALAGLLLVFVLDRKTMLPWLDQKTRSLRSSLANGLAQRFPAAWVREEGTLKSATSDRIKGEANN